MEKELAKLIDREPVPTEIDSKYEAFDLLVSGTEDAVKEANSAYESTVSLVDDLLEPGESSALYKDIYRDSKKAAGAYIRVAALAKSILGRLFDPPIDPEVDRP